MRDPTSFYRRAFLNSEENGGIAFVEAKVDEPDDQKRFSAELLIGDCSRVVTLYFGVWDAEDVTSVRQKIVALRRIVVAFEAALVAQYNELEKLV